MLVDVRHGGDGVAPGAAAGETAHSRRAGCGRVYGK